MVKKVQARKKSLPPLVPFLLLSFLLGAITIYLIISTTLLIPLNYEKKFEQIYDSQKRERGWETYVDLVGGFVINYPNHFYLNSLGYPITKSALGDSGYGSLLHIDDGKTGLPAYDADMNLMIYHVGDKNLLDFAKENGSTRNIGTKYTSTTINGREAIIADFTMTEQLYDQLFSLYSLNPKGSLEPVGYKNKRVFIRNKDFVYILQSGSLFADTEIKRFDKILKSFKFI